MAFANPCRGEVAVAGFLVRPSFGALVAAEGELGPLFGLVERAGEGGLSLAETVALLWHCLEPRPAGMTREAFGEAVCAGGLVALAPAVRGILEQILRGR